MLGWVVVVASATPFVIWAMVGALLLALITIGSASGVKGHIDEQTTDLKRYLMTILPNEESAAKIDQAAASLSLLLEGKEETIKQLERLSGRLVLLDKSASFSAGFLMTAGVALGIIAGVSNDWILHGSGWILTAANRTGLERGLEVAAVACIPSFLIGLVVSPLVDRRLQRRRGRDLPVDIKRINDFIDRCVAVAQESAPPGSGDRV